MKYISGEHDPTITSVSSVMQALKKKKNQTPVLKYIFKKNQYLSMHTKSFEGFY